MSETSSDQYEFEPSAPFTRSLRDLKKSAKGKLQQVALEQLFTEVVGAILVAPRQIQGHSLPELQKLEPEPWQGSHDLKDYEFWKAYFLLPLFSGAARHGRLMYVIHEPSKLVVALKIYTHAQYSGRPAVKELKAMFKEAGVPE